MAHEPTSFSRTMRALDTDGMSLAQALAHEQYHYPGFAPDYAERVARFAKK